MQIGLASCCALYCCCNEVVLELIGTNLYVLMLLLVEGHVFECV